MAADLCSDAPKRSSTLQQNIPSSAHSNLELNITTSVHQNNLNPMALSFSHLRPSRAELLNINAKRFIPNFIVSKECPTPFPNDSLNHLSPTSRMNRPLSILSGLRTLNPFAVGFIPNVTTISVGVENNLSHIQTNRLNSHAKAYSPSNIVSFIVASVGNISSVLPLNVSSTPPENPSVDSTLLSSEFSARSALRDSIISDTGSHEEGSAYAILNNIRVKNINKILIGHLNINSIRNKFDILVDLVKDKLDIILISETKIDSSFPNSQFEIQGYSPPRRLDRNEHGGGLLLYTRGDIHTKQLPLVSESIECVILEIIIAKKNG